MTSFVLSFFVPHPAFGVSSLSACAFCVSVFFGICHTEVCLSVLALVSPLPGLCPASAKIISALVLLDRIDSKIKP